MKVPDTVLFKAAATAIWHSVQSFISHSSAVAFVTIDDADIVCAVNCCQITAITEVGGHIRELTSGRATNHRKCPSRLMTSLTGAILILMRYVLFIMSLVSITDCRDNEFTIFGSHSFVCMT